MLSKKKFPSFGEHLFFEMNVGLKSKSLVIGNLWKRRQFELSFRISAVGCTECTQTSKHRDQKSLLGSVQMQTKVREASRWNCYKSEKISFQMRGVHRFLTRVGGQGRAKRELSTSRFSTSVNVLLLLIRCWYQALWSTFLSATTEFLLWRPVGVTRDHQEVGGGGDLML